MSTPIDTTFATDTDLKLLVARSSVVVILEIYIFSGPIRAASVIINNRLGFLEVYNLYMADTWR